MAVKYVMVVALLLTGVFSSCAPKVAVDPAPAVRITAPPEQPEIATRAAEVGRASEGVRSSHDGVQAQVAVLRSAAAEARGAAQKAQAELARLTRQQAASEAELVTLGVLFKDLEARNMFLEMEGEKMAGKVEDQGVRIKLLLDHVDALGLEAAKKDEEVAALRRLVGDRERQVEDLEAERARLAEAAAKAQVAHAKAAAEGRGYGKVLLFLGIAVALLAAGYVAARVYLPRLR